MSKADFKEQGFLGSGGIGRFRDILWAAGLSDVPVTDWSQDKVAKVCAGP